MHASAGTDDQLRTLATELREATTPIVGFLELIADDSRPLTEEEVLWVDRIEGRVARVRELIEELSAACEELRAESASGPPKTST